MNASAELEVSRVAYVSKVGSLYALLLADVVINAVTDTSVYRLELIIFITFLQVLVRFLVLMFLFLIATGTLLFRAGMLDILLWQFTNSLVVSLGSLGLMLAVRVFRIVLLTNSVAPEAFFQYDGYFALYVLHNLCSVLFYNLTISAVFRLSDPSFYDARVWRRRS